MFYNGLLHNYSTTQLAGLPYGLGVFGFEQVGSDLDRVALARDMVYPTGVFDSSKLTTRLYKNGNPSVSAAGSGTFMATISDENYLLEAIVVESDGADTDGLFQKPSDFACGSTVRLSWQPNTNTDFDYAEIYWDMGNANIGVGDFPCIATIKNHKTVKYVHTDAASGANRYYIKYVDIYGNRGPDVPTPVGVATAQPPTLAGAFTHTRVNGMLSGLFTPTSQSDSVVQILVFANYIWGIGLVDNINFQQPIGNTSSFLLPADGNIKLAAVGFNAQGMPSLPVLATLTAVGGVNLPVLVPPANISALTQANGGFRLQFTNDSPTWSYIRVCIFNDISSSTSNLDNSAYARQVGVTLQSFTIPRLVLDGAHSLKLCTVLDATTISGGAIGLVVSDWSDPVGVIIDSTYPAGSTLSAEVI